MLNKQGYAELKKTITITEGETLSLKETLVPGKSNSSVKNESVTKTVQTPKPQQPKTETAKTVKQNVTKPKVDDKFGFVTLNAAYSVAPQLSYGISFGSVKKVGWYLSAMSNFDFTGLNVIDKPFDEVAITGNSATTRLSATAGLVIRMAKPVYLKLGAGYGMRIRAAETLNGEYVKYPANTYEGIEATAGIMFRLGGFAISLDAVTTNFQMMEMKVGVGFGW